MIAEDDEECFDLITSEDDAGFYEKHYPDLREKINNSLTFALADDVDSQIVGEFVT